MLPGQNRKALRHREAATNTHLSRYLTVPVQAAIPIVPVVQVATVVIDRLETSAGLEAEAAHAPSMLTDEYLLPPLDAEILSYFAPEAQEYLESLEAQLLRLEKEQDNPEVINQLFRTAHTLKIGRAHV